MLTFKFMLKIIMLYFYRGYVKWVFIYYTMYELYCLGSQLFGGSVTLWLAPGTVAYKWNSTSSTPSSAGHKESSASPGTHLNTVKWSSYQPEPDVGPRAVPRHAPLDEAAQRSTPSVMQGQFKHQYSVQTDQCWNNFYEFYFLINDNFAHLKILILKHHSMVLC